MYVDDIMQLSTSVPDEEKAHGSVSMKTYINYFVAGGNYLVLLLVLVFFLTGEVSKSLCSCVALIISNSREVLF